MSKIQTPPAAIQVEIDPQIEPLIPKFLKNRRTDVERLTQACQASDLPTLREIAHALKGTSACYGFQELSVLARDIETRSRDGRIDGIAEAIAAIGDHLDRVQVVVGKGEK